MKQRELEASGLPEREARQQAQRAMGSLALARDRARDLWRPHWLRGCGLDLPLAVRVMVASPAIAGWLPAHGASRIDVVQVLRDG